MRVFSLGGAVADYRIGFEAQPATFDHISFTRNRLDELRDGS